MLLSKWGKMIACNYDDIILIVEINGYVGTAIFDRVAQEQ
jgi:hypothetical protein